MKRFTETDKWKDTWFRKLKPSEKLLWLYMLDNCNNAGVFEFDVEFCSFVTGMKEDQLLGAMQGLNRGYIGSKCGNLYFIKNFLRHQKNDVLNDGNNAHKQIISLLKEALPLFDDQLGAIQGLLSPTGKGKGKGKGKEVSTKDQEEFDLFWQSYPRKEKKQEALKSWGRADRPDIETILKTVEIYKVSKDWTEEGGKYIPLPTSWINQARWHDVGLDSVDGLRPFGSEGLINNMKGESCDKPTGLSWVEFHEKFGYPASHPKGKKA